MKKDYYLVLHLGPGATTDELRSAYRRLARQLHPDTSGLGSERFLELQEAYDVLSDPVRRSQYDQEVAEIPIRRSGLAESLNPAINLRRSVAEPLVGDSDVRRDISLSSSFESFYPSLDELFDRLWSNFSLSTRPKAERLESLTVDVPLSPEEACRGGTVQVLVPAHMTCPSCAGRGGARGYVCWHCDGSGSLNRECPLTVEYPAGLQHDYVVRVSLDSLGIRNLYLTVRFRPV
ncbi:MAG TPA: DnaJ domain-containing protein [Chthoniobacterales bacterium]